MPSEPKTPKGADLKTEVGKPSVRSVRSPYRSSQASGLNPARLGRLIRASDDGDTDAFFALCQEIEERDSHYRAVLTGRKQAVSGAELHVVATDDKRAPRKIADAVRSLVKAPEFEGLVFDLLDGLGKGVSFVEIVWDTSGSEWRPSRYEWREQRHFAWDTDTLSIPLLKTDSHPRGEPLAPYKWAVHAPRLLTGPVRRAGLSRTAAAIWMLKSFTIRDLMVFSEQYGMPIRVGKYGTNPTPEDRAALDAAITNIGTDAGASIPDSMKIEFVERKGGGSGEDLYLGTAAYWNGELSKLVLGQTMTTEDGSSLGQAAVHERKEMAIIKADARAVCATIVRDVITPFVRLNFGPDVEIPTLAYKIRTPSEQAVFMQNVTQFVKLGGILEQSIVRDELGFPDPPQPENGEPHPLFLGVAAKTIAAPDAPVEVPA